MPYTKSILRYPGGKTQLSKFIEHTLYLNQINDPIYCEPFCGGAGIAFTLLLNSKVKQIVLNDYDISLYSIWYAVLREPEYLIRKIQSLNVDIDEWKRQHRIYDEFKDSKEYSRDLAFAAFFLNRTNRSGIITGGPIGGMAQGSKYLLDCRFNKEHLIEKIRLISSYSGKIHLYHEDGIQFIANIIPEYSKNSLFVFFDPPYYKQGQALYKNNLPDNYHKMLAESIQRLRGYKWITTYDNTCQIQALYSKSRGFTYALQYSANLKRKEKELLYASDGLQLESYDKVSLEPIL